MELFVTRQWNDDTTFIGTMTKRVDENNIQHLNYTLEGVATAIPKGRYEVVLTQSPKFGFVTPELLHVPGRQFIRIHSGNHKEDTLGCILVGETMGVDEILQSRLAFEELMVELNACKDRGERMYITVQ